MVRRSTPQKKIDEVAFPVRVLLHGVREGFMRALGPGRDPHTWIQVNLGLGNAELYSWTSAHCQDGLQFLCRTPQAAEQFMAAFPEFRIADGTALSSYNSPYVIAGKRRNT